MEARNETITFDQMRGTIGSLILLWSNIENELRSNIERLNSGVLPASAHGIARSLEVWSNLVVDNAPEREIRRERCQALVAGLSDARKIRNLICHGLRGIRAGSSTEACLTVRLKDTERVLSWCELQEMFAWLSSMPHTIDLLSGTALERNPDLAAELPPRHWLAAG